MGNRTNLRRSIAQTAATLALVGMLGGVAAAKDFCIKVVDGNAGKVGHFIGKAFKVPGPGKCKPFMGLNTTDNVGYASDVTGSACTANDGHQVRFVLTINDGDDDADAVRFVHITLPLPLGPYGAAQFTLISGYNPAFPAGAEPCSGVKIP